MRNMVIAILLILICYVAIFISSGAWKRTSIGKKIVTRKQRSPVSDMMLRIPGDSLRIKEFDTVLDYGAFVGLIPAIVLLGYIWFISINNPKSPLGFFTIGVFTGTVIWCLSRLRKAFKDLHSLRLGLDGEMATAQELNQLMLHGHYVYHDFPAEDFNIDHVVIGPAGVFSIETKSRLKPKAKGKQSVKVSYDGDTLRFPDGQEPKFISQAVEQAKWLSKFLNRSVGKPVYVTPVLTLPGWIVDRLTDNENLLVMNPKEAVKLIPTKKNTLDKQTIQQVRYQVEQRCRTVKPYDLT